MSSAARDHWQYMFVGVYRMLTRLVPGQMLGSFEIVPVSGAVFDMYMPTGIGRLRARHVEAPEPSALSWVGLLDAPRQENDFAYP